MRKNILIIIFVLIIILLLYFAYITNYLYNAYFTNVNDEHIEYGSYCYKINSLIKDIDFYTAKIEDEKIILRDNKEEIINEIAFKDYAANIKIIYKKEDTIYFVKNRVADDEQGIVFFINNASN